MEIDDRCMVSDNSTSVLAGQEVILIAYDKECNRYTCYGMEADDYYVIKAEDLIEHFNPDKI